jgi:hypothetical protein
MENATQVVLVTTGSTLLVQGNLAVGLAVIALGVVGDD